MWGGEWGKAVNESDFDFQAMMGRKFAGDAPGHTGHMHDTDTGIELPCSTHTYTPWRVGIVTTPLSLRLIEQRWAVSTALKFPFTRDRGGSVCWGRQR